MDTTNIEKTIKKAIDSGAEIKISNEMREEWENQRQEMERKRYQSEKELFKKTKITTRKKKRKCDIVSSSFWQVTIHDPVLLKEIRKVIKKRALELGIKTPSYSDISKRNYKETNSDIKETNSDISKRNYKKTTRRCNMTLTQILKTRGQYIYNEDIFKTYEKDGSTYERITDTKYALQIIEAYKELELERLKKLNQMTPSKYRKEFYETKTYTDEEKERIYRELRLISGAHNALLQERIEYPSLDVVQSVIDKELSFSI